MVWVHKTDLGPADLAVKPERDPEKADCVRPAFEPDAVSLLHT